MAGVVRVANFAEAPFANYPVPRYARRPNADVVC
jgi:hypothetical protein